MSILETLRFPCSFQVGSASAICLDLEETSPRVELLWHVFQLFLSEGLVSVQRDLSAWQWWQGKRETEECQPRRVFTLRRPRKNFLLQ